MTYILGVEFRSSCDIVQNTSTANLVLTIQSSRFLRTFYFLVIPIRNFNKISYHCIIHILALLILRYFSVNKR